MLGIALLVYAAPVLAADKSGIRGRDDDPSDHYIAMCDDLLEQGLPANWTPVVNTQK